MRFLPGASAPDERAAPPDSARPTPPLAYVLGTVGLVGLASFGTFGIIGLDKRSWRRRSSI